MAEENKSVMHEHQPSMTEWLASIGEEHESMAFRQEDNTKDERLEILYQTIGTHYERTIEFPARELADKSPAFAKYLAEHGDDLCALRLVPKKPDLPKLRNRGLSVREVYENWFLKQNINPDDYIASFRPHARIYSWSLIFVINHDGVYGEMIPGQHAQLTHGDTSVPTSKFRHDFTTGEWHNEAPGARGTLGNALVQLYVPDAAKQKELQSKLDVEFSHGYVVGYYECIVWPDNVIRFGDFNRILNKKIAMPPPFRKAGTGVSGTPAFRGKARGRIRIVKPEDIATAEFADGDVLVTDNTDVRFIRLMKKAGAIVTDRGGMLSHASIIARELRKPCIVGTGNATLLLKEGRMVEVDAEAGVVTVVE